MDSSTIFNKTPKASRTALLWVGGLSAQSKRILSQVDGKQSVEDILRESGKLSRIELQKILLELEKDGYIHRMSTHGDEPAWLNTVSAYSVNAENNYSIAVEEIDADDPSLADMAPSSKIPVVKQQRAIVQEEQGAVDASSTQKQQAEDVSVKTKREAQRKAQAAVAEKARQEAAEQAKRIALAEAKARQEVERIEQEKAAAENKAKAAEQVKLEAEEKARQEAVRLALEAAEQARIENERIEQEALAAKARQEAEEQARLEAERIKQEKAEAKRKAEAAAKAKREAEEKARQEAERIALEAAEQARIENERIEQEALAAKARQEAEEQARLEAERIERENAEIVARIKAEAEEEARQQAAIAAQAEAAAQARREAEEAAQLEKEMAAREEANELARQEKEAKALLKAEQKARASESRDPGIFLKKVSQSIKPLLLGITLAVIVIAGLLQFINLTAMIKPVEELASATIGEPVTVEEVHVSLLPQPHLLVSGVAAGKNKDVKIGSVYIPVDMSMLFKDVKVLKSVELSTVTFTPANIGRPAQWISAAAKSDKLKIGQVALRKIAFDLPGLDLEPFNGKVTQGASGSPANIELASADGNLALELTPQNGSCTIKLTATGWKPPLMNDLELDEVTATAVASHNRVDFSQVEAKAYGGTIRAEGVLEWAGTLNATGKFELVRVTLPRLLSAFGSKAAVDGAINANATFMSKPAQASDLVNAAEVNASFEVSAGKINGISLSHAVLAGSATRPPSGADFTRFDTLAGNVHFKDGQYRYKRFELETEQLRAHGSLEVEPDQTISGEVGAELISKSVRRQARFNIGGKVADVKLQ